jgi:hypothetical protein
LEPDLRTGLFADLNKADATGTDGADLVAVNNRQFGVVGRRASQLRRGWAKPRIA